MALAATGPLIFEEVQLLADCFAPVFATEIPIAAEALILRGLLRAFMVRETRTCYLLAITDDGRSYVETWIEQHGKAVQHCDCCEPRPVRTRRLAAWTKTGYSRVLSQISTA